MSKNLKYNKLIILGPAASGKDYARQLLEKELGYSYCPVYTTRPKRDIEIAGKDYIFVSDKEFNDLLDSREFLMYKGFNDNKWYYGIKKSDFDSHNLIVLNYYFIRQLRRDVLSKTKILYFNIDKEIRRKRLLERNDIDSVDRRLMADEIDFSLLDNWIAANQIKCTYITSSDNGIDDLKRYINEEN